MKRLAILILCVVGFSANVQTAQELMGKWQLVKWTQHGKEKDIMAYFKSDQIRYFRYSTKKANSKA